MFIKIINFLISVFIEYKFDETVCLKRFFIREIMTLVGFTQINLTNKIWKNYMINRNTVNALGLKVRVSSVKGSCLKG